MEVLHSVNLKNFDVFNLAIPKTLAGVESSLLNPINTWKDKDEFIATRNKLAKCSAIISNAMKMSKRV